MILPDSWESARFQALCVAWSGFRQNGVLSSRPPAGTPAKYAGAGRTPLARRSRDIGFISVGTCMNSNSDINIKPTQRIYYSRGRRFARFMSHVIAGMFALWGLWILYDIYRDPSFAPFLIIFIPVAVYSTAYYYALTDTCVIMSETGIEYRRPEFSIVATWSQIKSLKRNVFFAMLGLQYYLLLDAPTIIYTKWFGLAYKLQLTHILFPAYQKRIPLGKMWQGYEQLQNEIRAKIPSLPFESP